MTEDTGAGERAEEAQEGTRPEDDEGRLKRGWNRGLGFLSAVKEAIDETLDEARDRGDLNPQRAKEIMREALDRAQEAAGEAKSRLEFVPRKEFEALQARVEALEAHLGVAPPKPAEGAPEEASEPGEGPA